MSTDKTKQFCEWDKSDFEKNISVTDTDILVIIDDKKFVSFGQYFAMNMFDCNIHTPD